MKKILICTRKNKSSEERNLEMAAAQVYKERGGDAVKVVRDEELSWKDLKAIHGNFAEAARAVGTRYDVVVLVEDDDNGDRTLGRGQHAIASAALSRKNIVAVARPGPPPYNVRILPVKNLLVVDPESWAAKYSEVVL